MTHPEAAVTPAAVIHEKPGNLSVTALYTAGTWFWGGLPGADLLASDDSRNVFAVTNFVLALSSLLKPNVRSLRHSLLHRHTMIDHLATTAGAHHILELAAGLSRRGVAQTADPAVRYTEIDLAPMIAHKRRLLARTPAGSAALDRPGLRLIAGDVIEIDLGAAMAGDIGEGEGESMAGGRDEGAVETGESMASARGHAGAGRSEPLFVIAEGLHMYLKPEQQRVLWRKVHALLAPRGGTFVFDLIPACEEPKPGAIGNALGWLMKRFTGGRTFERDARTRADLASELNAAGFNEVVTLEPASVAHEWKLPFPDVPTQQLLFVAKVSGPAPG